MDDVVKLLLAGLVGGVVGPVLLEEYRSWRRERLWKIPRKRLLKKMLSGELVFRSLDALSRTSGAPKDECRSLLIELGARGGLLEDGREGWAMISRAPLDEDFDDNIVRRNREVAEKEAENEV